MKKNAYNTTEPHGIKSQQGGRADQYGNAHDWENETREARHQGIIGYQAIGLWEGVGKLIGDTEPLSPPRQPVFFVFVFHELISRIELLG